MKNLIRVLAALITVAAFGFAGCVADTNPAPTVSVPPTAKSPTPTISTTTQLETPTTSPSITDTPSLDGCPTDVVLPDGVNQDICGGAPPDAYVVSNEESWEEPAFHFATPSDNIRCEWNSSGVRCSMLEYDFHGSPMPTDCDFGWDDSLVWLISDVEVGDCVSERITPWYQEKITVFEYGTSYVGGEWACSSQRDGLTCWNTKTFHGFKLSRAAQLVW
ncbi:MAG: hypothetical protein FWG47_03295 [Propionibacteriaceae bacterium]|nr:hypothetical protein [Propionibacteriaceae bacterium]